MKKSRAGTMTHGYKPSGTTILFAALNVLDDTVISRNPQRHQHRGLIRFLNAIKEQVPTGTAVTPSSMIMRLTRIQSSPRFDRHPRWNVPFHTNVHLMAQRRRGILCNPHKAQIKARRLPFRHRSPSCNQSLP